MMSKPSQTFFGEVSDSRPPELQLVWRSLLGFRYSVHEFIAEPFRAFRPMGLLIWNVPEQSTIRCEITSNVEIVSSFDAVPARWFASAKSFEQLAESLQDGKEPPTWCDWHVVCPGQWVRLQLRDSQNQALGPSD